MDKPPRINIIYDSRRIERYEPLMNELSEQNISDFELWPCLMYADVVSSINLSHKMIVRYAKEKGLRETCIAEDDLQFTSPNAWQYFISNKPKEYDLYLAATYIIPIEQKQICGFHLYMVHEKFYDTFLSIPDDQHIDTFCNTIKGDYHFTYPFPALQRPGFSSNNKAQVNYNSILREQDIYK